MVYTFGSKGEYVYLDNMQVSHRADVTTYRNYDWDTHACIGWAKDHGYYTGIIDEALVFNDHVSADDVNALYLAAPSYDGNSEPELEAKAEVKPKNIPSAIGVTSKRNRCDTEKESK